MSNTLKRILLATFLFAVGSALLSFSQTTSDEAKSSATSGATLDGMDKGEDLRALVTEGDQTAATIVDTVQEQRAYRLKLQQRSEELAAMAPVAVVETEVPRQLTVPVGISLLAGGASFVLQSVFARLSDSALAEFYETNDLARRDTADRYANASYISAGAGILCLGIAVPLIALDDRSPTAHSLLPEALSNLFWEDNPQAVRAQLQGERIRLQRRLAYAVEAQRAYTLGTVLAGVVGAASGAITGLAINSGGELYQQYRAAEYSSDARELRRQIEARRTVAIVGGAIATAGIATTVALLSVRPRPDRIRALLDEVEARLSRSGRDQVSTEAVEPAGADRGP